VTLTDEYIPESDERLETVSAGPGQFIRLEVTDTGQGIDTKTLNRIFDPYFTTKKPGKGTGLGLAVVEGIINKNNGFITIKSEIGQGTQFQVYWPVSEGGDVSDISKKTDIMDMKGTEKILIVDDEPEILLALKSLLEKQGYQITSMEDATSALTLFKRDPNQFDLIITDMTMPLMTGTELSKHILTIRKKIPIILCTGYQESLTKAEIHKLGICEFLYKPVKPRELFAVIRKVLNFNSN